MNNTSSTNKSSSKPMNIETALNRISWRFKNSNIKIGESKIIINQSDIEAVDFLTSWITNQKEKDLQENLLFAKLYCYALINELEFYKDIKFANNKLQEILSSNINTQYESVANSLNRLELNKYLNSVGIVTDHLEKMVITEAQEQKQQELIKTHQSTIAKYVLGVWNINSVYKSLNNTITECINKYKNYK